MCNKSTLYSIGHGQKSQEKFILELKSFDIHYIADVRSNPYSKWAPQYYNRGTIEGWLRQEGIKYTYMGDNIGGRANNDKCYDEEGYFDYRTMAEEPSFKKGLQRLVKAHSNKYRVAIMCSESNPTECHRSKLIGRELYSVYHISVNHIVAVNKIISQEEIIKKLTKGSWEPRFNLFTKECDPPYFKSRKSYRNMIDIIRNV